VTWIKSLVYNYRCMAEFRYGRWYFEEGEYALRKDVRPQERKNPVVEVVENLGTTENPCGRVDCRGNCLEYLVRPVRGRRSYGLNECKLSPLVNIL